MRGVFFQYLRGNFPKLHDFSFSYFRLFFCFFFLEGFGKEFGSVLERVENVNKQFHAIYAMTKMVLAFIKMS